VTVTEPGFNFQKIWQGKPDESGYSWRTTRHAAEAVIETFTASDDTGAEVERKWSRSQRRHLGYFKSVAAAKRLAEAKAGQKCQKAVEEAGRGRRR
jgi:hypothetical protein